MDIDGKKVSFGRVYIFEMTLDDGTVIHKVGMVNSDSMSRVTDRLMEVLRSFFMVFRKVPSARIVKAQKFLIPYIVENHLHKLLAELKYKSDKKWDGSNELFANVDVDALVDYIEHFKYACLLEGKTSMPTDRYNKIKEAIIASNGSKNTPEKEGKIPF